MRFKATKKLRIRKFPNVNLSVNSNNNNNKCYLHDYITKVYHLAKVRSNKPNKKGLRIRIGVGQPYRDP